MRTAYHASTPSWPNLAMMRKRGQRPAAGVYVTDHGAQRSFLVAAGLYAVELPHGDEVNWAAGLDIVVIADRNTQTVEAAQRIAGSNPRYLATYWRGVGLQVVIP